MKILFFAVLLFVFALSLRLWNLNAMGRTWDEQNIVEKGYDFVQLAIHHDFSNKFWYDTPDHPPLSNYLYGIASTGDFIRFDKGETLSFSSNPYGAAIFQYDLTFTRLVSVLFSSIAVVLVFFIGVRLFSLYIGVVSGIVLAMLPHFLGYSQLATHESLITCFFTATVFSYILYFQKKNTLYLLLAGILTGITLELKQSNILLFVFLLGLYFLWKHFYSKKHKISLTHIFLISLTGIITYFVLWPMPLFHFSQFIAFTNEMWFENGGKIPELLFGIPMGGPFFFYIVAYFVTTPVVILLLGVLGIIAAAKKKTWEYWAIILWFIVPFLMSFFHQRQMMVRYIIEFYAPLSILCAVGLEHITSTFTGKRIKYITALLLTGYLALILIKISPYYLDYYNEIVGGTTNVYKNKLFFLGEWGQGLKGPGKYIATYASKNDRIGMALNPAVTLYRSPNLVYEPFDATKKYDYVIVNTFNILRLGFNDSILYKDYEVVYREKADGAVLATVYRHK
jgi:4-amino-4-deoxy-L-arabinose transferase-like glycosyltransferase